jgi:hypothetical protein
LAVEATGDPTALVSGDIAKLENAVESSLIESFAQFCDPQVRTVIDVAFETFVVFDTTTRALQNRATTTKFRVVFTVKFNCQNCPQNAKLLTNDAAKRALSAVVNPLTATVSHETSTADRKLSTTRVGNTCYCDVNSVANRPPSETEVRNNWILCTVYRDSAEGMS